MTDSDRTIPDPTPHTESDQPLRSRTTASSEPSCERWTAPDRPEGAVLLGRLPDAGPSATAGRATTSPPLSTRSLAYGRSWRAAMTRPDGLPIYLTADEAADLLRTS